jgi:hypothetical protein
VVFPTSRGQFRVRTRKSGCILGTFELSGSAARTPGDRAGSLLAIEVYLAAVSDSAFASTGHRSSQHERITPLSRLFFLSRQLQFSDLIRAM